MGQALLTSTLEMMATWTGVTGPSVGATPRVYEASALEVGGWMASRAPKGLSECACGAL